MEYLTWGSGPKTLLFIQGGPGSVIPKSGMLLRMIRRQDPYAKAGYAVWMVTRRRHMPAGHTIAGMAGDYAQLICQEFGGRVDLVVGVSYGGLIGQYLAAFHPGSFGHMALVGAGLAKVPGWVADVDSRSGAAIARRDTAAAGTVMVAEYLLPAKPPPWASRLIGPLFGRLMFGPSPAVRARRKPRRDGGFTMGAERNSDDLTGAGDSVHLVETVVAAGPGGQGRADEQPQLPSSTCYMS